MGKIQKKIFDTRSGATGTSVSHDVDATLVSWTADRTVTIERLVGDYALIPLSAIFADILVALTVVKAGQSSVTLDTEANMDAKRDQIWYLQRVSFRQENPLNLDIDTATRRTLQPGDKIEVRMRARFSSGVAVNCMYLIGLTAFFQQQ